MVAKCFGTCLPESAESLLAAPYLTSKFKVQGFYTHQLRLGFSDDVGDNFVVSLTGI